jgi:hypothetical protein
MKTIRNSLKLGAALSAGLWLSGFSLASAAPVPDAEGWVNLFDGRTLQGWKPSEHTNSWTVRDGAIVAHGDRSHLFYVADDRPFQNFEFQAEVMTKPGSNGGIFFHTKWQDKDWPRAGMEVQVNNTYTRDPIKTGSLYGLLNVTNAPAADNEWFTLHFRVEGKRIVTRVNGRLLVDYTEPANKKSEGSRPRLFAQGTFALQAHDPGSTILYRNLRVKRLP